MYKFPTLFCFCYVFNHGAWRTETFEYGVNNFSLVICLYGFGTGTVLGTGIVSGLDFDLMMHVNG